MKTAVSIPDPLFEAADQLARQWGVSRSELYARALLRLLASEDDDELTATLDAVYAHEESALDEGLAQAQRRATAERW